MTVALSYTVSSAEPLVVISGEYADPVECSRLLIEIVRDPRCQGGCAFLRDLRSAHHPVDVWTVVAVVDLIRQHWLTVQPCRAAIVTRIDELDIPIQVAQALADTHQISIRAFDSYEAALAWLREGFSTTATRAAA